MQISGLYLKGARKDTQITMMIGSASLGNTDNTLLMYHISYFQTNLTGINFTPTLTEKHLDLVQFPEQIRT
jgi:hypothetical protein